MSNVQELPIVGRTIDEVGYGIGGLWLRFWMPVSSEYGLHIEGPFSLIADGATVQLDPKAPDLVWFSLVGRTVDAAEADLQGSLQIRFSGGSQLNVPSYRYEAWQLEGPDGLLFVSVAGGGLAVWPRLPKSRE
jgi:hypothetical protein